MLNAGARPPWAEKPHPTLTLAKLIVVGLTVVMMLYPMLTVVSTSLSNPRDLQAAGAALALWPKNPNLNAYRAVLTGPVQHALVISVIVTTLGTLASLIVSTLAAYALSRTMFGRKWFVLLLLFTFLFPAGLIPTYLVVRAAHLLNNYMSLVLPTLVSAVPVILLQQFFLRGIPEELIDSARLDGATEWSILRNITLPLSKPVLAIAALLYAVDQWSAVLPSVLYLDHQEMWPLPMMLRFVGGGGGQLGSAVIVVSILPIALLYPWLQRYFFRDVLLGALRG